MSSAQSSEEAVTGIVTTPGIDPLVGQVLDGRFRVVEPIGKGGMGAVYRAMQLPMERTVALKVLDYNFGAGRDEGFRQRFLVEAALTAKLNHPNTVTVIDYGCTSKGIFYIAMEYLEGETLGDLIDARGPLPWRRVLNIGQQIARSLREAHALGVVHRDLKPANVMISGTDTDQVKVLDFGLVKSFVPGQELEGRAITQQGMLMGSPPYMAPEQGDRNEADPRSDVYSLGIVLYEALTGSPPFTGDQPLLVIMQHINMPVPLMRTPPRLEPIPPEMEAVVMKCLAKSPMDRFQSMDELLAAMHELTAPAAYKTPATGTPAVAAPGNRYLPAVLFLAAMLIGVGTAALLLGRPKPAATPLVVASATLSPEPKPSSPSPVLFHIDSEPSGATVYLEGRAMGTTPVELPLAPGADGRARGELVLKKDGFLPLTVTAIGTGPRIELIQKLQPAPRKAVVAAPPAPLPEERPTATRAVEAELQKAANAARQPEVVEEKKAVASKPAPKHRRKAAPAAKLGDDDEELPSLPKLTPTHEKLKKPSP
jgi:serine/threonine-protein kinase